MKRFHKKDKLKSKKINKQDYIYHRFTFDPKIQEHTFIGNEFIGMDTIEEMENMQLFDRVVEAGPDGFIPNLVEELKIIFGEGNYIYDGYEIGEEDFGLYFFIKKELYDMLIKKVKQWSEMNDIAHLIMWE